MGTLFAHRTISAVVVTALAVAVGACNETRRSFGEECLKGDDCVSGLCSSQHCTEPPPFLEPGAARDAAVASDAALPDAPVDGDTDASDGAKPDDGAIDDAAADAADGG